MTFTVEQKSQLARLMATENIRVEHARLRTAMFDVENRVLYLPIWKDMSGMMYDLLCGHEVGHALYTPAAGWHDAVLDSTKSKNYKHFLNVVEDARIEKKIKRRFPGLSPSFRGAYDELLERDFFGIADRNINAMPFIDRLNIYTKSQYTKTDIRFSSEERDLLELVQNAETWQDTIFATDSVYAYSKSEQSQMQNSYSDLKIDGDELYEEDSDTSPDGDDFESDDSVEEEDTGAMTAGDSEESKESEEKIDSEKNGPSSESSEKEEDKKDESPTKNSKINRHKDSQLSHGDQSDIEPECATDEAYRENEKYLLDGVGKEYVYLTMPKPIMKDIVTPAKIVQKQLTEFWCTPKSVCNKTEQSKVWVDAFKKKNERYVSLLAKEFHMRKAAKAFSKSKLSDTGDIDIGKLSNYKFSDDIFRKVMLTPNGKSHGMMLLLDKSGSMSYNMPSSIEQILILALFCRKVNIPFCVYGFGDAYGSYLEDRFSENPNFKDDRNAQDLCFSAAKNQIRFSQVFLREYINSNMSGVDFSAALRNMIILGKSYERFRGGIFRRPKSESLGNTPLTQAIYACAPLMNDFRKKNNLDITSLVVIHDGDTDSNKDYFTSTVNSFSNNLMMRGINLKEKNFVIRDESIKYEYMLKNKEGTDFALQLVLDWFKKSTQSKVFGFFLIDQKPSQIRGAIMRRHCFEDGKSFGQLDAEASKDYSKRLQFQDTLQKLVNKCKEERYMSTNALGYDGFYIVLNDDPFNNESEDIDVIGKVTSSKLKSAFMKLSKKRQINRVLVSQFIQGIAV